MNWPREIHKIDITNVTGNIRAIVAVGAGNGVNFTMNVYKVWVE